MDEWQTLAEATAKLPLLAGVPKVGRQGEEVLLREGRTRWPPRIIASGFGVGLVLVFFAWPGGAAGPTSRFLGIGIGALITLACIWSMLRCRRLRLPQESPFFEVCRGALFKPTISQFRKDKVRVRLMVAEEDDALPSCMMGDTVLFLERMSDGMGVKLACSPHRDRLHRVFKVLLRLLGGADDTVVEMEVPPTGVAAIPVYPCNPQKTFLPLKTRLVTDDRDSVAIRATWSTRLLSSAFFGTGAVVMAVPLMTDMLTPWWARVLLFLFGCGWALAGLVFMAGAFTARLVVANSITEQVTVRTGVLKHKGIGYEEIVGIQVCPKMVEDWRNRFEMFELNVIFRDPEKSCISRVNVYDQADREATMEQARILARFTQKPVIDGAGFDYRGKRIGS